MQESPMHISQLDIIIPEETIRQKIVEYGKEIDALYEGKELTIVCVMKGAICFVADLIRNIHVPCTLECIQASSYGMRGTTPGEIKISGFETLRLESKDVLLIDDICDTGTTL